MPTREEVREGIDRILFSLEADEISIYEAKQQLTKLGVVIKVDGELPNADGCLRPGDYMNRLHKAGFGAFIPLVER